MNRGYLYTQRRTLCWIQSIILLNTKQSEEGSISHSLCKAPENKNLQWLKQYNVKPFPVLRTVSALQHSFFHDINSPCNPVKRQVSSQSISLKQEVWVIMSVSPFVSLLAIIVVMLHSNNSPALHSDCISPLHSESVSRGCGEGGQGNTVGWDLSLWWDLSWSVLLVLGTATGTELAGGTGWVTAW